MDLKKEKKLQEVLLDMIKKDLIESAHDCSEGGLAVCLAECVITNPKGNIGAAVKLVKSDIRSDALLFGESQSRIVISVNPEHVSKVSDLCKKKGVPCYEVGEVDGDRLKIDGLIDINLKDLEKAWKNGIPQLLNS